MKKGKRKMNTKTKVLSTALALAVSASITALPASAASKTAERDFAATYSAEGESRASTRWERFLTLSSVSNKSVWSYARKSVTVGGKVLSVGSITVNGTDYIPSRLAATALGLSYSYNSSTRSVTVKGSGLEFTFSDGCYVAYANGRALFSTTPCVIMSDGRMYIPKEMFAKATGLSASSSESSVSFTDSYKPLVSADKFYRADEVFWLARIIHAESNGEPLLGQIAVGNVVLNRVKSAYYPNTIYGVIFDRKYGVQFSPVLDGSIYNTPSYLSTLAAKICLEGYDVSLGTFFFLRPEMSTSSWIPNNRIYAFSIGKHDFYY